MKRAPRLVGLVALLALGLTGRVSPEVAAAQVAARAAAQATATPPAGFWLAAGDGGVFTYGDVAFYGSAGDIPLVAPVVGVAEVPSTQTGSSTSCCLGYWLVASDGGVFTYGSAQFFGSLGASGTHPHIVAMAATPSGNGYWVLDADGTVFAFGDGDRAPTTHPEGAGAYIAIVSTSTGHGYWLLTAGGSVVPVGDAAHLEVTGGATTNGQPIVGMAVHGRGTGLWVVAADGSTVSLGDAPVLSPGAKNLAAPVVGIGATLGDGYWLALADGIVKSYGDAPAIGPSTPQRLNKPITAISTMFH